MLQADTKLEEINFLTARERNALQAGDINCVEDILRVPPRRYEDRRFSAPLSSLANGESACLQLRIYSAAWRFSYTRFYELVAGAGEEGDIGARILLRWYNMPYISKLLAAGMQVSVYGKLRSQDGQWVMCNPDFEVLEDEDAGHRLAAAALGESVSLPGGGPLPAQEKIHTDRLVPIYRSVSGLSARSYRSIVWRILKEFDRSSLKEPYDPAPGYPLAAALADLHFPDDERTAHKARLRLALSECFGRQFAVAWNRRNIREKTGLVTATTDYYLRELVAALPFRLTAAQQRCLREIRADMAAPVPMHRLLQGDVGSGKTLVALCAMLLCVESGKTAALLAPTQILAEQHYRNFCRLLQGTDLRISLRTSGRAADSDLIMDDPQMAPREDEQHPRLLVGTHALLYEKNRPRNLGLAVIDEQHKFGVAQRERFVSAEEHPDLLVMTATPIPRTLTLTLYGDLDVSLINEMPAGRGEVVTALRHPGRMKRIISFLRNELSAGRQAYIVSPLIEKSEASDRASATAEVKRWQELLPEFTIGLLHGRMTPEEKERTMTDFRDARTQLLVATTVIEVGVDVANATIMIINNADSFGLSQLHQLRGRIGRGTHKSWCILLSAAKPGEPSREKLEALCRTCNGFEIAEEDFRLRGPGDVLGTAQSGLAGVHFPEWLSDTRLIYRANKLATDILERDPSLSLPEHAGLREFTRSLLSRAVVRSVG